ncbi:MAG: hypothetical protein PVG07_12855 [Acidobacteriota bacterium]|jgi:hypothetical protein
MKRAVLTVALLLTLAALPAGASTFVAMSDAELVAQSDAIVIGEVLETFSYWNESKSMIFTEAVIHVHDVVAGDAPALLNVRTPGGTVGSYRVEAHGFPAFGQGQRQLLFVHRGQADSLEVTGFQQGQYRIERRRDGVRMAVPALSGVQLLTRSGVPAPRPEARPLEDLVRSIRSIEQRVQRGPVVK